jgi:hypothetical protein
MGNLNLTLYVVHAAFWGVFGLTRLIIRSTENVSFCRRFGFEITGEIRVLDIPNVLMWRDVKSGVKRPPRLQSAAPGAMVERD